MLIASYKPKNLRQILSLFYETVPIAAAKDYTPEQLDAWAPRSLCAADEEKWDSSLSANETLLAWEQDRLVGFGDADETGYLDRLYVASDRRGTGVGTEILKRLEAYAAKAAAKSMYTHASDRRGPFLSGAGILR